MAKEEAQTIQDSTDSTIEEAQTVPEHHRNLSDGRARAAVFGVSDGLVSNMSLAIGMAAGGASPTVVKLAGLDGLVAGAVSMAAGELVSMRAQRELLKHELSLEAREIRTNPEAEMAELAMLYRKKGPSADLATAVAIEIHTDPEVALETHAREELGIDPDELGSPTWAAVSSFFAFAVGALIPILSWFLTQGGAAVVLSMGLGLSSALGVGGVLGRLSGRSSVRGALRQAGILLTACGATFAIGSLFGVAVS